MFDHQGVAFLVTITKQELSLIMSVAPVFDKSLALAYLGLPDDYEPSPQNATISFLVKHVTQLPPHLLAHFSYITSPKDRTIITTIRNRRLKYAGSNPPELTFASASNRWPNLWQGREQPGVDEAVEERAWADNDFLQGARKHVGNLGNLLGGYEEEREAERVRILRRERQVINDLVPEEDESSDEGASEISTEEVEDKKASFERLIRERFVYGLLEASCNLESDWNLGPDSICSRWNTTESIGMNLWTVKMIEKQKSVGLMKRSQNNACKVLSIQRKCGSVTLVTVV